MDRTFTSYGGQTITFDVVIDDLFANLKFTSAFDPSKKALLSLVNTFEDGDWKGSTFHTFLWNHIKETALTYSEKASLIGEEATILETSAKNLRLLDNNDDDHGGEIGEILLYGIMNKYYGALPVVPKIFYKQNASDYAKGADSVHIVLDRNSDFTLWLGEAKFYSSLDDNRLGKIVASVAELLRSEKLRKEFSIVTSLKELDFHISDESIRKKVVDTLKEGISLDEVKKHLHVPILLLHECTITAKTSRMTDAYKQEITQQHLDVAERYMKKQIELLKGEIWGYQDVAFHVILFPVPEKSPIVKKFFDRAKHLRP